MAVAAAAGCHQTNSKSSVVTEAQACGHLEMWMSAIMETQLTVSEIALKISDKNVIKRIHITSIATYTLIKLTTNMYTCYLD